MIPELSMYYNVWLTSDIGITAATDIYHITATQATQECNATVFAQPRSQDLSSYPGCAVG